MTVVARVARVDGSLLVLAGVVLGAAAIWARDWAGGAVCGACGAAGVLELVGARCAAANLPELARRRLLGAQILVAAAVTIYAAWQSLRFDGLQVAQWALASTPFGAALVREGIDAESLATLLRQWVPWGYAAMATGSVLLQTGLSVFYARRLRAAELAAGVSPKAKPLSPSGS